MSPKEYEEGEYGNSPGRGERNSHQVGIGRGISGRQKSIKKGTIENSPGVIR